MTRIASSDRYAPRTCWMTVSRLGLVCAVAAGASSRKMPHRHMSEDLKRRSLGLPREQILNSNLPTACRIINGHGYQLARAAFGCKQISGVVGHDLSGGIHHVDMEHVARGGRGCREAHAELRVIAALHA